MPSITGLRISQSWPERRVEVLRAQVRAGELVEELAARPERPEVRAERRQPDLVRLVDVVVAAELVARPRLCDRAHSGRSWRIHRVQISRSAPGVPSLEAAGREDRGQVPDDGDPCGDGEGDDENPASVEPVRERIDDRGGEREDRRLDRLEGADGRQEARSCGAGVASGSGEGAGRSDRPSAYWTRCVSDLRKRMRTEARRPRAVQPPIESQPPSARTPIAAGMAASVE